MLRHRQTGTPDPFQDAERFLKVMNAFYQFHKNALECAVFSEVGAKKWAAATRVLGSGGEKDEQRYLLEEGLEAAPLCCKLEDLFAKRYKPTTSSVRM